MSGGPAVLFDLDGTLLDTNYLHTLAWWRALEDAGQRRPMAALHRLVGMGSQELLTEVLGHDDAAIADAHGRHYQRLKGELTTLPGARELVAEVAGRGATVVVATSAKSRDLDDLLRVLDVGDQLDHVLHAADVPSAKPAGDLFARALEAARCPPERALAVGDTVWDVEAAGRVGVGVVAVLTGGNCRDELLRAGARAVYRDAAELVAELDRSPLGVLLAG